MDTSSVCSTAALESICSPLRRRSDSVGQKLDCCEAQELPDLPDLAQCPRVSSRLSLEDCSRLQLQEVADFVQLAEPLPVASLRSLSSTDETLVHRQLQLSEPGTYMGLASPRQLDSVQEVFGVSSGLFPEALLSAEHLQEGSVSSNALGCRGLAAVLGEVAGAFPAVVGASEGASASMAEILTPEEHLSAQSPSARGLSPRPAHMAHEATQVGFSIQQQLPEPAIAQPAAEPVLPTATQYAAAGQPPQRVPATASAQLRSKQPATVLPLQHLQQLAQEQQGGAVLPNVQLLLRQRTSSNASSIGGSATTTPRAASRGNNTAHLVSPGLQARLRAAELAAAGRFDPISWAAAEAEAIQADTEAAAAAARRAQQQHIEQELQKRKAEAARVAVQLAEAKEHFSIGGSASAGCEVATAAQPHQQLDAQQESLTQLLHLHRKSVPGRLIMTDYSSSSSSSTVSTDARLFTCASAAETQRLAPDTATAAAAAASAEAQATDAFETESAAVIAGASPELLLQDISLVVTSSLFVRSRGSSPQPGHFHDCPVLGQSSIGSIARSAGDGQPVDSDAAAAGHAAGAAAVELHAASQLLPPSASSGQLLLHRSQQQRLPQQSAGGPSSPESDPKPVATSTASPAASAAATTAAADRAGTLQHEQPSSVGRPATNTAAKRKFSSYSARAAGKALRAGPSGAAVAMAAGKRPPTVSLVRQQQQQQQQEQDDSPQSGSSSPTAAAAGKSCNATATISNSSEPASPKSPALRLRIATRLPGVSSKQSPRSPAARAIHLAGTCDLSPQQSPKLPASGTSSVTRGLGGLSPQSSLSSATTRLTNQAGARVLSPQQSPKSPASGALGASLGKSAASTARLAWNSTTRIQPSRSSSSSPRAGGSPKASGSPTSRSGSLTSAVRSPLTSPPLSPSTSSLSIGNAAPSRIPRLASSSSSSSKLNSAASSSFPGHQPQLGRQLQAPQPLSVQGHPSQKLAEQSVPQLQLPQQRDNSGSSTPAPAAGAAASPAAVQAASLPASAAAANPASETAEPAAQHIAGITGKGGAAATPEAEVGKIGSATSGSPWLRVDDVQRFNVLDFTAMSNNATQGFSADGSCSGELPQSGLGPEIDAQEFCGVSNRASNAFEQSLDRPLASELQQPQTNDSLAAACRSELQAVDYGADTPHHWPRAEPLEFEEADSSQEFVAQAWPQSHQLMTSSFGIETTVDADAVGPGPQSHMLMSTTVSRETGAGCFSAGLLAAADAGGAVDRSTSTAAGTTCIQLDASMQGSKPQSHKLRTGTFSTDGMTSTLLNGAAADPAGNVDSRSAEVIDSAQSEGEAANTSASAVAVAADEAYSTLQSGSVATTVVLERTAAMLQHHYLRKHGDGDCLLMPPDLVVDRLSPRSSGTGCIAAAALSRTTSAANSIAQSPNSSIAGSPGGCRSPAAHSRRSSLGGAAPGCQHRPRSSGTGSVGGSAHNHSGSVGGSQLRNVSRHASAVGFGQPVSPSHLAVEASAAAAVAGADAAPPDATSATDSGLGQAASLSHSAQEASADATTSDAGAAAAGGASDPDAAVLEAAAAASGAGAAASDAGAAASDAGAAASEVGVAAPEADTSAADPCASSTAAAVLNQQHAARPNYKAAAQQSTEGPSAAASQADISATYPGASHAAIEVQEQQHADSTSSAAALARQHIQQSEQLTAEAPAAAASDAAAAEPEAGAAVSDADTTAADPPTVSSTAAAAQEQQHTGSSSYKAPSAQQLTEGPSAAASEADTSAADPWANSTAMESQEQQHADRPNTTAALAQQQSEQHQSGQLTAEAPATAAAAAASEVGVSAPEADTTAADSGVNSTALQVQEQQQADSSSATAALAQQHIEQQQSRQLTAGAPDAQESSAPDISSDNSNAAEVILPSTADNSSDNSSSSGNSSSHKTAVIDTRSDPNHGSVASSIGGNTTSVSDQLHDNNASHAPQLLPAADASNGETNKRSESSLGSAACSADLLSSPVLLDGVPQKLLSRHSSTQSLGSDHTQPENTAPLSEQPPNSPAHFMTSCSLSCLPRQTADTIQPTAVAQSTAAMATAMGDLVSSNELAENHTNGLGSAVESMVAAQGFPQQLASAAVDLQHKQQQQPEPAASIDHPDEQQQQRHRASADTLSGHLKLQQLIPQKPKPRQQQMPARILTWDADIPPAAAAPAAGPVDQPGPAAVETAADDAAMPAAPPPPAAAAAAAAAATSTSNSGIQRSSSGSPPAPVCAASSNGDDASSQCEAAASGLPVAIGTSGSVKYSNSSSIPQPSSGGSSAGDLADSADRHMDGSAMAALIADDKQLTSSFKRALLESICCSEEGSGEQQHQQEEEEGGRHARSSSNEPTWQQQQQISNVVAFCFPRTSSVPAFGNRNSLAPSISGHSYGSPRTSSPTQQQQRRPAQVLRRSDSPHPGDGHDAATNCAKFTGGSYHRGGSAGEGSNDTDHPAAAGGAGDAILTAAPMLRLSKSSSNIQSCASSLPNQQGSDLGTGFSQSGTAAVSSPERIRRFGKDLRSPSFSPISEGTNLSEGTDVSVTTLVTSSPAGGPSGVSRQQQQQDWGSTAVSKRQQGLLSAQIRRSSSSSSAADAPTPSTVTAAADETGILALPASPRSSALPDAAAAASDAAGPALDPAAVEGRVRGKNSAAAALLGLGIRTADLDPSVWNDHHHHQQLQQQPQEQNEQEQNEHEQQDQSAGSDATRVDTNVGRSSVVDQPTVDYQQEEEEQRQQQQQEEQQQTTPRRRNRVSWADTDDLPVCSSSSPSNLTGPPAADLGDLDGAFETPKALIRSSTAQAVTKPCAVVTSPAAAAAAAAPAVTSPSAVASAAAALCGGHAGLPPACPSRSSFRKKGGLIRPSKSCMEFSSLVAAPADGAAAAVAELYQQQQQQGRTRSSPLTAGAAASSNGWESTRQQQQQQQQQVNVFTEAYAVKGALPGALPAAATDAVLAGSSMEECSAPANDPASGSAAAAPARDPTDHQQQHVLGHVAQEALSASQPTQAVNVPARRLPKSNVSGTGSRSAPAEISLLSCSWHEIEPLLDQDEDQNHSPQQNKRPAVYSFEGCFYRTSSSGRPKSSGFTNGCGSSRQQQQQQQQKEGAEVPDAAGGVGATESPRQLYGQPRHQQASADSGQQQVAAAAAAAVTADVQQEAKLLNPSTSQLPSQQQLRGDSVQQQVAAAAAAAVAAATQQESKPLTPSVAQLPQQRSSHQRTSADVEQQQVAAAAAAAVAAAIRQETRHLNPSFGGLPQQQQQRPSQQQPRGDSVQQQVAAAAAAAVAAAIHQEGSPITFGIARLPQQQQQQLSQQQPNADVVQQQVAAAAAAAVAAAIQHEKGPISPGTAQLPQQQQQRPSQQQSNSDSVQQQVAAAAAAVDAAIRQETRPFDPSTAQRPSQQQTSGDSVQQQVAAAAAAAVAADSQMETHPFNPSVARLPQQQQERPHAQRRSSWFGFPWQRAQEVPSDQQQQQQQRQQQPVVIDTLDLSDVMLMGQLNMHDSALALQTAVHRLESQTGGGMAQSPY